MEVAGAVIGNLVKKMLFDEGWVIKKKGHLVHSSQGEIIQMPDDGPVLARKLDGSERECSDLFAAIRFVKGIDD
jgi:hypothetical protein